ncbi:ROK family transcriptional regulator [Jannaschia seohaensis]|uniref:Putative NBD/HSP70 family sugar kinase n=1 Tax=Jannaschia seohaensis TaxID=475081 RepID=A0A2Y9BAZ1_9RHOB|nr:ROK family transcriptional regulator [Jannaschia seohaensis]PWJ11446.1 putative NBD/HSP70 family sugar kinase [Jannaschia seohaensis]SSA51419.1 Sugar kinase of the NBD/HSP70 family, may contain an N-terminal HTH domain [Jannaschia seohaensis]
MAQPPTPRGVTPARSRDHNRQLVLGHLQAAGALGRAEIARRAGLSTQAVSNIIAELEGEGLLRTQGLARGRRGLPAPQYVLAAEGGFALGIEVRPGALLAALLDLEGRPVWHDRRPLASAAPEDVGAQLPGLLAAALAAAPQAEGRLLGAGVALPGPFGRTGIASDLPGWDGIAAAEVFAPLGLTVTVENDANAAALGARIALAPEGVTSFACLYFGTGLGLAIVQDGRLVVGAHGNAGEIGHVPIPTPNGPQPLEALLSRLSVERHLRAAGRKAGDMDALAALHAEGDPALADWIAGAAGPLGLATGLIENLLDPQTIVLCGAMPEGIVRDLIAAAPLTERSVARREGRTQPPLRVGRCSRLAAVIGAGALVLNRTFTPALAA